MSILIKSTSFIVVHSLSHVQLFATSWTAACLASLSLIISQNFPQVHVHRVSDAIQPSHPLSSPSPPAFIRSIRVFSNELALHIRWPRYWGFSFSISPSSEYSGFISLKTDWLDFLDVQGTFRSLLQCHSSKASILWHCTLFMVQLSQLYVTTKKNIVLTIQTLSAQ